MLFISLSNEKAFRLIETAFPGIELIFQQVEIFPLSVYTFGKSPSTTICKTLFNLQQQQIPQLRPFGAPQISQDRFQELHSQQKPPSMKR